jgi:predicted phage tail protein
MNALTSITDAVGTTCTIYLHGRLKRLFGESVHVPGSTVAVAIRNMLIKKPEIRFVLEQGEYRVVRGNLAKGIDLDASMLAMQIGPSREIHLFPAAEGGGGHGGLKVVLGAVLIVAAVATAGAALAGYGAAAGLTMASGLQLAGTIGLFGASLLLGGISQLIAPQPGLGASYLLNGNLNTAQQGTVVPLIYGRARCGSIVAATAYAAEDYTTSTSDYTGAGAYYDASGGFSGYLKAFDTGNPLPPGATGKGGGGKGGGGGGIQAPNTLESKAIVTILDIISEGPITGIVNGPQGIYFNNTPLMNPDGSWNFRGVRFKYLFGNPEQAALSGFPSATEDVVVNTRCFYSDPLVQQLQSTTASQARVTIELPALLATNTQNGDVNPSTLNLMIEVAEVVGTSVGTYSQVIYDTIHGKCTSPYQKSYVFDLPGVGGVNPVTSWNIRLTKLTPESAVSTTVNELYWFSYDLITNNLIGYEDSAGVLLQIDSEAFGSSLPNRTYLVDGITVQVPLNYSVSTRTYATTGPGTNGGAWDYVSFQPDTCSNPAWILYDFLSNSRYGLGLSSAQLETLAIQLYEIAQYCDGLVPDGNGGTEPRYELNGVFNQRASAFQIMQAIAATFRGQVYWAGGQVCVSADMPGAPIKIYTSANVIDGNFVYEGTSLKTRHTMANVHFTDPTNQYLPGVEPVEVPQQVAQRGIFSADILGFGVTSRGLAHRLGNWLLYTENFQTETVTFSVSWDSAAVLPGNLIQIADSNIAGIRMGGRLRSNSTVSALALDMPFTPTSGQTYEATVVLDDGTLAQNVTISSFTNATTAQGAAYTIANLASPLIRAPLPQAVFVLQDANVAPTEWQVVGITETGQGIFEIVAAQYNPGKFALVEDVPTLNIPSFSTAAASLVAPLPAPANVTAITSLSGQGVTTIIATTVSWQMPNPPDLRIIQTQVSVVNAEGTTIAVLAATGTSVEINNLPPDTYYFAARSLGKNGSTSSWAYSAPFVITGQSPLAPPAVTGLSAIEGPRQTQLVWYASDQRDVQYYNVWRSSSAIAPHLSGSLAALIGTTSGTSFADVDSQTLSPGTNWNYWVEPVTSTGVVGAMSAMVSVAVSYITSGDLGVGSVTLPAFVTDIQPIGIWTSGSLPPSLGAANGANSIYWSVTGQLYTWNSTANAYQAATPTAATLGGGALNAAVSIPSTQITGALVAAQIASIDATQITGALVAAQIASIDATQITGALVAAQIASIDATQITGAITSTQIGPGSITTPAISSGAVTTTQIAAGTIQAGNMAAGSITAAALAVGSPNNVIWNSCASLTDAGWVYVASGDVITASGPVAGSSYASSWLLPGGSGYIFAATVNAGDTFSAWWEPVTNGVPVVAGQTYIGQAAFACQNIPANVKISWLNSSGTVISSSVGNVVAAGAAGGTTLSEYGVSYVVAVAPAGATTAILKLISLPQSATTNGLVVWSQALFGQVGPSTVGPVAWTPGGVTQISGGQLMASSVTANQIAGQTITGNQIAAGTITGNNILAGSIAVGNLAAGTLSASNITAGTLDAAVVIGSTANLGTVQITNANIASLTVGSSNLANNAVTNSYALSYTSYLTSGTVDHYFSTTYPDSSSVVACFIYISMPNDTNNQIQSESGSGSGYLIINVLNGAGSVISTLQDYPPITPGTDMIFSVYSPTVTSETLTVQAQLSGGYDYDWSVLILVLKK